VHAVLVGKGLVLHTRAALEAAITFRRWAVIVGYRSGIAVPMGSGSIPPGEGRYVLYGKLSKPYRGSTLLEARLFAPCEFALAYAHWQWLHSFADAEGCLVVLQRYDSLESKDTFSLHINTMEAHEIQEVVNGPVRSAS
jgi:hypothetical protein